MYLSRFDPHTGRCLASRGIGDSPGRVGLREFDSVEEMVRAVAELGPATTQTSPIGKGDAEGQSPSSKVRAVQDESSQRMKSEVQP